MKVIRLIRVMLSILLVYWLGMGGLLVSHAYNKGWIFANFESIDAKQALHMLQSRSDVLLLDVRTVEEYQENHLQNAINIPVQSLDKDINTLDHAANKQILVYCRSGNRSVKASRILKRNAFIPINIKGGIQQLKRHDAILIH